MFTVKLGINPTHLPDLSVPQMVDHVEYLMREVGSGG